MFFFPFHSVLAAKHAIRLVERVNGRTRISRFSEIDDRKYFNTTIMVVSTLVVAMRSRKRKSITTD